MTLKINKQINGLFWMEKFRSISTTKEQKNCKLITNSICILHEFANLHNIKTIRIFFFLTKLSKILETCIFVEAISLQRTHYIYRYNTKKPSVLFFRVVSVVVVAFSFSLNLVHQQQNNKRRE